MAEKSREQRLPRRAESRIMETDSTKERLPEGGASLQAVEKVEHSWAFSHLYGKISMGDERCLNEGSWIVES